MQEKVQEGEMAFHAEVSKLVVQRDLKKNAIFKEREALLKAKNASKAFWPLVLRMHPDVQQELMGPYDDQLLNALLDFTVVYNADGGYRLAMSFAQNDFFQEQELWLEVSAPGQDGDGVITTSGMTWKPGHGPVDDQEEEADTRKKGAKSGRAEAKLTQGPSFFELFEEMLPPPAGDTSDEEDEEEEEDDEEEQEYREQYDAEYGERMEVIHCLVEEVWEDPLAILMSKDGDE